MNYSSKNASKSSKNNNFYPDAPPQQPHTTVDVVIVGAGIAGLCAALEMPQNADILIVEENHHLLQSASANALGIIGGRGCKNAQNPRSHFRKLLQKSINIYPQWLKKHFGDKITLKKIILDHNLLKNDDESSSRIKKLIEEEKAIFSRQKYKDFLRQHPKNTLWENKEKENDEVITFFDTMAINAHDLIHLLKEKLARQGKKIYLATKVQKIEKSSDIFEITLQKKEEKTTSRIFCRQLILAAGAKTSPLLAKMGFLVKSFFSWGEIIADYPSFLPHWSPTAPTEKNLWRWKTPKVSYLFDDTQKNPTTTIAGYEVRNKWNFDPLNESLLQQWLQKNTGTTDWPWRDLGPWRRYGMRVRARDWLPLIGWLEKNLLVISSLHKSGLTLAPMISRCVALLWSKKINDERARDPFLSIVCPKRKKNGLRRATKSDFYCSYYPFD